MEEARLTASMEREYPYAGERVELATKHSKESAIAPALAERLGLRVHTPFGLDTDALGTFIGEVERVGLPREVAARKARLALEVTGHWLGLASEGSFRPHPVIPFMPAGAGGWRWWMTGAASWSMSDSSRWRPPSAASDPTRG